MLMLPYIECYMLTAANCTWYKKYDDSPKASGLSIYEDQNRRGRYVPSLYQLVVAGMFYSFTNT